MFPVRSITYQSHGLLRDSIAADSGCANNDNAAATTLLQVDMIRARGTGHDTFPMEVLAYLPYLSF